MSKKKKEEKGLFGNFFSKRVIDQINDISDDEIEEYADDQRTEQEIKKAVEEERRKNHQELAELLKKETETETQLIQYKSQIKVLEEKNNESQREMIRLKEIIQQLKEENKGLAKRLADAKPTSQNFFRPAVAKVEEKSSERNKALEEFLSMYLVAKKILDFNPMIDSLLKMQKIIIYGKK